MRIALFGDSHLAALKAGFNAVPVPMGAEVEFWGTPGNRFRHIEWRDGRIEPLDDAAANAFARFNGQGRRWLDPADFDAVAFVGVRIRAWPVFGEILNHLAHPDRHLSDAFLRAVLADHLRRHTTYQMAQDMADTGQARVLLNLVSFDTAGKARAPRSHATARAASPADLALLWDHVAAIMADDGIECLAQPADTVVDGYYTDPRFGVAGTDAIHKNAEYGARILSEIYARLKPVSAKAKPEKARRAKTAKAAGARG